VEELDPENDAGSSVTYWFKGTGTVVCLHTMKMWGIQA